VSGVRRGFVSDMYVVGMILNGKGAMGFVNVRSGRLWDAVKRERYSDETDERNNFPDRFLP